MTLYFPIRLDACKDIQANPDQNMLLMGLQRDQHREEQGQLDQFAGNKIKVTDE